MSCAPGSVTKTYEEPIWQWPVLPLSHYCSLLTLWPTPRNRSIAARACVSIQAGSSSKDLKLFSSQRPRCCLEVCSENWHTRSTSMNRCRPANVWRVLGGGGLFRQIARLHCWGISTKKNKTSSIVRQGHLEHVCKRSGAISYKRRVHIFIFVR